MSSLLHIGYRLAHGVVGRGNFLLGESSFLGPLVLRIRITQKCNLSCSFCYLGRNLNTPEKNHLSLDEWKTLFEKLPRWTILDITGAEPFLAKDFKTVLQMALEKRFKISLTTNGFIDNDEVIKLMVSQRMTFLMLSLDGLEDYHNKIRGNEKSFQKIVSFCGKLNKLKKEYSSPFPKLIIKTTITNDNSDDLVALNRFAFEELKANSHSFNLMFQNEARGGLELEADIENERFKRGNDWRYQKESIGKIKDSIKKINSQSEDMGWEINFKPDMKEEDLFKYIENPINLGVKACYRTNSIISMYYDGTLAPCDLALNIGNIRDIGFDLKKIWKEESFKKFLKSFDSSFHPACDGCCLVKQQEKP